MAFCIAIINSFVLDSDLFQYHKKCQKKIKNQEYHHFTERTFTVNARDQVNSLFLYYSAYETTASSEIYLTSLVKLHISIT